MAVTVETKKNPKIQKSIKGWFNPQMTQMLQYVFSTCFIDCRIVPGKTPTFLCQLAKHTDAEKIEHFKVHFLDKNGIDLHFNYVEDPPRNTVK